VPTQTRPVAAGFLGGERWELEVDGEPVSSGASAPFLRWPDAAGGRGALAKIALIGGARRQVDLELGFELDDTGSNFDQATA
jgi:hypothetical protein